MTVRDAVRRAARAAIMAVGCAGLTLAAGCAPRARVSDGQTSSSETTVEERCPGKLGAPCAAFDTVFDNLADGALVLDGGRRSFTRQPAGPVHAGTYTLHQDAIDATLRSGDAFSQKGTVRLFFQSARWREVPVTEADHLRFAGNCDPDVACEADVTFRADGGRTYVSVVLDGTVVIS
ncbi:MAG TPA: hypothetical protein VFB78_17570 [Acidimicrobiales bacterium]|nr:hypothetical protein [Acidimicrobiales bacterium]